MENILIEFIELFYFQYLENYFIFNILNNTILSSPFDNSVIMLLPLVGTFSIVMEIMSIEILASIDIDKNVHQSDQSKWFHERCGDRL